MAFDHTGKEIADVNLDNYFLDHQFYNTYTYVHKKFLPKGGVNKKSGYDTELHSKINKKNMFNNSQQYDMERNLKNNNNGMKKARTNLCDNSVIEQTIQFAKDLVPTVIPPSREFSPTPVYYTIKASNKLGKKISKPLSSHIEYACDAMSEKSKSKAHGNKLNTNKVDIHEDRSVRESASHFSEENTLDEFQINQSSNFSESEILDINLHKTEQHVRKRKHGEIQRNIGPMSLEAKGTEIDPSNQANINFMNETEKSVFYENLTAPIIKSVREYLHETNKPPEIFTDLQSLKQSIDSNTQKLDYLIQVLTNVEKKIMNYTDKCTKIIMSPKDISSKASRLEELAEDLFEIKEGTSTDQEVNNENNLYRKIMTTKSAIVTMSLNHDENNKTERRNENSGHDEKVPIHSNVTCCQLGVKPDRPNRIPARFCWTDTTKKF